MNGSFIDIVDFETDIDFFSFGERTQKMMTDVSLHYWRQQRKLD